MFDRPFFFAHKTLLAQFRVVLHKRGFADKIVVFRLFIQLFCSVILFC